MPKFVKGHKKVGGAKKGSKYRKTIIKESLGIVRIDDLKEDVLKTFNYFITKGTPQEQLTASKEVAKYCFPAKKELDIVEHNITVGIEEVPKTDTYEKVENKPENAENDKQAESIDSIEEKPV